MLEKAIEYQRDAAEAHQHVVACQRLGLPENVAYWQGRARHFADMARFFMGLR